MTLFIAKIYFWAQSYCHGLQPGDSYLATIYDGGINSWLNAKMQEWIQDGDHVSSRLSNEFKIIIYFSIICGLASMVSLIMERLTIHGILVSQ